jgi:hypothetical protein
MALILMFYYYNTEKDEEKCLKIIGELEYYSLYENVAKLLFNYYGRNLHLEHNRTKFDRIVKNNARILERDPIHYYFFKCVEAAYNKCFDESYRYAMDLRSICPYYNPVYHETWRDAKSNEPVVFSGIIIRNSSGKFKVRIIDLQQSFRLRFTDGLYIKINDGMSVEVLLHFYLTGIRAEIVSFENTKNPELLQN